MNKGQRLHAFSQSGCEPAMTWIEIAESLGYRDPSDRGRKAVFMVYANAMRKLRAEFGVTARKDGVA